MPHRQVVRARIVLDAAAGLPNALIARRVGVTPTTHELTNQTTN